MFIEFWFLIYKFLSNTVVLCGAISDTLTGSPVPILPCFIGIFVFLIMCTDHCSHISVPFRDICFLLPSALGTEFSPLTFKSALFCFFNFCFPCGFLLFIRLCYLIVFKSLNWSGFKSLNWSGHSLSWVSSLQWSAVSWDWDGKLKTPRNICSSSRAYRVCLGISSFGLSLHKFIQWVWWFTLGPYNSGIHLRNYLAIKNQNRWNKSDLLCLIVSWERWLRKAVMMFNSKRIDKKLDRKKILPFSRYLQLYLVCS